MTTRIEQPLSREPVEIDARAMTSARRKRIIQRDGGCCRYPGCDQTEGLEVDHIVALALGGRDSDDNLECLCSAHHRLKTALDVKLIAKAKRNFAKHTGTAPPPLQKIKSRGFKRRWEP